MHGTLTETNEVQDIIDTSLAFWKSKVLLTAVSLDLFTKLGTAGLPYAVLLQEFGLNDRGARDFLDSLVAMGFLDRTDTNGNSLYACSRKAARYLDKSSPAYMGGVLEMVDHRVYGFWSDLEAALKTGLPQNETKTTGHSWYQDLYQDKTRLTEFMFAMAGYQSANFTALAEIFDFAPYSVFCDVGGATGALAIRVAERYPNMKCKSFDLAVVQPIATATIKNAGLQDRIEAIAGDFVAGPLPDADVICLGNIMHNWDIPTRKMLIGKAFAALPVGGAFLGMEHFIDDDRRTELDSMLMSLNMLIETQSGSEMTKSEFEGYCREAGFNRVEFRHVSGGTSVGIAWK